MTVGRRAPEDPAGAVGTPTGTWRSLHHAGFRYLLAAQFATSSGNWMEQVARGWLVYDLTGSPLLLGAVQAIRGLPLLIFGLVAGVTADRYDRKRQLVLAQGTNMVINLTLGVLIVTGRVEVWHVFATAFLAGTATAFQQPARQSLLPQLVPARELMNGIALNSGVLNLTRTVGPAIAGLLIVLIGTGGSYLFQAGLYLMAVMWTRRLPDRPVADALPVSRAGSPWQTLTGGFAYVRRSPTILMLLAFGLVPIMLAQPYTSLAPVFARDIFDIGAFGQGVLLAVPGLGAVIGATYVARLGPSRRRGPILVAGVVGFGTALVVFSLSPWLPLALGALFVVGWASTTYRAVDQTIIQSLTEDAYRGRVMSMHLLDQGLAPLGSLFAGAMAATLGARDAVLVMGALTVLFALICAIRMPAIRRLA